MLHNLHQLQIPKKMNRPLDWNQATAEQIKGIRGVCLDIDDTLSTSGKLTSEAFCALWKLKEAGFVVVPVTGRPAGWCDHIARFWPVDAVVGENGAFSFFMHQFMNQKIRKRIDTPSGSTPEVLKKKLSQLAQKIQSEFPQVMWASDQAYREYDLAIDVYEDVKPWSLEAIQKLLKICHQEKAHAKLSSVHVNAWFGDYDKQKGFTHWLLQGAPGCTQPVPSKEEWIYIGDSPNDEPMFSYFKFSVGVSNLKPYLDQLNFLPTWLTVSPSGQGFVEMANRLIEFCNQKKLFE